MVKGAAGQAIQNMNILLRSGRNLRLKAASAAARHSKMSTKLPLGKRFCHDKERIQIMQFIEGGVTAAKGFLAGGIHCGIRKNKTKARSGYDFQQNALYCGGGLYAATWSKGAPILVTKQKSCGRHGTGGHLQQRQRQHLQRRRARRRRRRCAKSPAEALGIDPQRCDCRLHRRDRAGACRSSRLRMQPRRWRHCLSEDGSTCRGKGHHDHRHHPQRRCAVEIRNRRQRQCSIGGISKGSGMIHPNMATMLCFLTTDCAISAPDAAKGHLRRRQTPHST